MSDKVKSDPAEVKGKKTEMDTCGVIGCAEVATRAVFKKRIAKLTEAGLQVKTEGKHVNLCEKHYELTKEEAEKEKPKDCKPCGVLDNGTVFESIYLDKKPCFLCYDGKKFYTENSVFVEDVEYSPTTRDQVPYRPYQFSQAEIDYYNANSAISGFALYEKVKTEFDTFICAEDPIILSNTIRTIESYVQHLESSVGYGDVLGAKGSGKTRLLELYNYLGYRPMFCTNAPSADIFRYLGFHGAGNGMILEDECDKMEEDVEKMKIYRSGYRKGAKVPRMEQSFRGGFDQVFFPTYCIKVFAGIDGVKDTTLRDRCDDTQMIRADPLKDEIVDEESAEEGTPLTPEYIDTMRFDLIKKELLVWRMQNYHTHLPAAPNLIFKGRFKEIWKGKLRIALLIDPNDHKVYDQLYDHALALWKEEEENIQTSMNADLAKACMIAYFRAGRKDLLFKIPWGVFQWIVGVAPINESARAIDTENYGTISSRWIAKILRNEFGFKTKRISLGLLIQVREAEGKFVKILKKYHIKTDEVEALNKRFEEETLAPAKDSAKSLEDTFGNAPDNAADQAK
ncbi:MAG: hypothetical protein WED04_12520 [Promethearchaeati archaeon SRVP18_Atabeyarchaeia-1]